MLRYEIDLPTYSDNRARRLERPKEIRENEAVFQKGIIDLFNTLGTWQLQVLHPIRQTNHPISSSLGWDRWRFDDNHLSLTELEDTYLPRLLSVVSLKVPTYGRLVHPSAIARIVSLLPGLEQLDLQVDLPKPKRAEMQREHWLGTYFCFLSLNTVILTMKPGLSTILKQPLTNLRSLCISIKESTLYNHDYQT